MNGRTAPQASRCLGTVISGGTRQKRKTSARAGGSALVVRLVGGLQLIARGDDGHLRWKKTLHPRVVQHNVRVVAKYYRQISVARLANLLGLSEDEAERHVSHMVSSNGLYCKIDRPAGIAQFHKPKPPDEVLQDWAGDISKMLNLVEMTCHLINKESMPHKDVLGL